jgi:predicted DNA-binding protein
MSYTAGPTSIRLTEEDADRIHRLASKQGVGQATVIRLALRLGLTELEQLLEHPAARAIRPANRKV